MIKASFAFPLSLARRTKYQASSIHHVLQAFSTLEQIFGIGWDRGGGEIASSRLFREKRSPYPHCTRRGHRGDGDDGRDEDEDDVPLRSECIDQGADDLVRSGAEARGPLAAAERPRKPRGALQLPLGLPSRPPPAGGPVRGLPAEGRRTHVEGVVVVVRVVVVLPSPPNPDFSLSDRPAHGLVPTALQRVQNSHEHCGS